jgi:hypothetical protein
MLLLAAARRLSLSADVGFRVCPLETAGLTFSYVFVILNVRAKQQGCGLDAFISGSKTAALRVLLAEDNAINMKVGLWIVKLLLCNTLQAFVAVTMLYAAGFCVLLFAELLKCLWADASGQSSRSCG